MKHHLREEKNCLNCGSEITDRYCSHCGQENIEPKETVGYLVRHFLGDITHYDSKFLTTIRDLLWKPGFLTKEYLAGRRTAYLNPIRMYVFISAIFFLLLFLVKNNEEFTKENDYSTHAAKVLRQHLADSIRKTIQWPAKISAYDSGRIHAFRDISASLDTVVLPSPAKNESIGFNMGGSGAEFVLQEDQYNSVKEYDSVQHTLAEDKRDKGFLKWVLRSNIRLKEKYGSRRQVVVSENFNHSIPKLMFILLPVFALFIYLLHNKKKYYYAQHVIFSIHFHSFIFFILLIRTLLSLVSNAGPFRSGLYDLAWVISFVYLVISLKNVYQQSVGWSLLKAFTILILYIIFLIIGIISLAIISFFTA